MAFIKINSGADKGKRFDIERDETTIGRASDNAIVLNDASVSSHHCVIIRQNRRFTIKDMDSTNGTELNGIAVKEHQLSPGDELMIGSIEATFDGPDVDGFEVHSEPPEKARVKIKSSSGSSGAADSVFEPRRKKRWLTVTAVTIGFVVLLSLLAWFIISISEI